MYENNRYVIFAEGIISIDKNDEYYVVFPAIASSNIQDRQTAIDTLITASFHTCTIDVRPEDQILLLVTCEGNDAKRRIVAARCIRDGEDEDDLRNLVEKSKLKQTTR